MTIKVKIEDLYNEYKTTMQELCSPEEIKNHSLEPKTQSSFQRSLSRRANISLDKKQDYYTDDDIQKIIDDTDGKINEYKSGNYSTELKEKGVARYTMFAKIFKGALNKLNLGHLADKIKIDEPVKREPIKVEREPIKISNIAEKMKEIPDSELPFYVSEEEERRAEELKQKQQEDIIPNAEETVGVPTIQEERQPINQTDEELLALIPSLLQSVPRFIQNSHESAHKVTELEKIIIELRDQIKNLEEQQVKIPDTDEEKRKFIEEIAKGIQDVSILKESARDLAMLFTTR